MRGDDESVGLARGEMSGVEVSFCEIVGPGEE